MATNMFIKFEGPELKGESTDETHKDEIAVLSWSHGFSQPTSPIRVSAGGGTVEQANHSNFLFTKYIDSSTDDILKMCWSGKHIDKATFTCYRASGEKQGVKYLQIIMEKVIISNYSISGGIGDLPVENIALDYGSVQYNYIPQKETDGTGEGAQPIKHDLILQKVE